MKVSNKYYLNKEKSELSMYVFIISPQNWEGEMITMYYGDKQAELDLKTKTSFTVPKAKFPSMTRCTKYL